LIVDECENLLTTKSPWPFLFGGRAESRDKSWLDYFLEQPRARCIWICNDISGLDPAVQRRFSFSLEFPKFGRRQRVKIWERSREELKGSGGEMLSDAEIGRLAETYEVNAGVINQSLRKSLEAGADSESKLVAYLESHLRAHLALSGQTARRVKVTPDFRLSALNTSLPAAEIEQMLAKWREQNWGQDLGSRLGLSFLFHGLPGSGKTELGRYLGQHLDMEVIHLQVSDILSKYVGESEKRVAEAFREAEAREAILHIDEVESFFLNRDKAVHSWETTLVNEFLTGLENFRGVFIGSTNRIGDLDAAALSRFSLKVEFKPITSAARTELFQAILSPLTAEPLTAGEEQVLHQLGGLTPRDFKVAALQYRWRPSGNFTNLDLIEALRADVELRERQKEETSAKPAASPSAIN
jgi:AAA+ superfamily predicted ATPase